MFKKLYDNIILFLRKKDKPAIILPNKDCLLSIDFQLAYDGKLNIICYWPKLDDANEEDINNLAEQYAKAIYMLDSGLLKKEIVNTLSSINDPNNASDNFFVYQVLNYWLAFTEQFTKSENDPLIKPSNTFSRYK